MVSKENPRKRKEMKGRNRENRKKLEDQWVIRCNSCKKMHHEISAYNPAILSVELLRSNSRSFTS
jgi:hypothetical protein